MPITEVTIWTLKNNKDVSPPQVSCSCHLNAVFGLSINNVPDMFRQRNLSTPGKKWCLLLKPLSEGVAEVSEFFRGPDVAS